MNIGLINVLGYRIRHDDEQAVDAQNVQPCNLGLEEILLDDFRLISSAKLKYIYKDGCYYY